MIRAKLENGIQIILNDGKWSCADSELTEMLNSSQEYWRSKESNYFQDLNSQDHVAAAKVLAQFGGEVDYISLEKYVECAV